MSTTDRFKKTQKILSADAPGTVNFIEGENAKRDIYLKEHLPLIKCECGTEILVLPDLRAMNRAINTHVAEHKQRERTDKKNVVSSNKICERLSHLTLVKAGEESETE
jgi:hypothetical protein